MAVNIVVFSGFIGNIKYQKVNDEFSYCDFSLAWSYKPEGKEEITHWINFKAYNKTAEFIEKWFHKGESIEVMGQLRTESWEDKSGDKRTRTFVVVDRASFPPSKKEHKVPNPLTDDKPKQTPADTMAPPNEGIIPSPGSEDDLPF